MTDVFVMRMAEIVDRYNAGKMENFSRDETVYFLKALFNDSPNREMKIKSLKYFQ